VSPQTSEGVSEFVSASVSYVWCLRGQRVSLRVSPRMSQRVSQSDGVSADGSSEGSSDGSSDCVSEGVSEVRVRLRGCLLRPQRVSQSLSQLVSHTYGVLEVRGCL
jgi:hypothetical protein